MIDRRNSALAWLGASFLCLAATHDAQEESDTLYLTNGSTENGKVLEEAFNGVSFQPEKGAKKVVPWNTVRSIDYSSAPEELSGALATLAAGNPEAAGEELARVLETEGNRPMIVQQALFHLAWVHQRLGQADEAVGEYGKLLKDFPKGRYLRNVGENLVDLYLAKGDPGKARSSVADLAQGAKGLEGFDLVTGLLEAKVLEGEGKAAEAGQRYAAVEGAAAADPGLAQEAKLGRARMLLHENKGAEAEPILRALISESTNPRVQSGAWNGLGELQAADGRAKKNSDRILDALYAYLRSVVQYKPLPGESTEEYERALAGAATCFRYLSELEQNPEKKKQHRDRERERLEQLQLEFPNSAFLKK